MLNKVQLIGNLGRDPEVKYSQAGMAITNFTMATSEKWKDKSSGEVQERTEWHRCVAFGRLGEVCGEYLKKGKRVYIEGKLQTRSWEQDGSKRYATEIVVGDVKMLDQAPTRNKAPAPQQQGDCTSESVSEDIPF